jgi:hypothetical protein
MRTSGSNASSEGFTSTETIGEEVGTHFLFLQSLSDAFIVNISTSWLSSPWQSPAG